MEQRGESTEGVEVGEGVPVDETNPVVQKKVWKLYLSRLLTAWGDRLWSFGLGLFLFKMHSTNLTLIAGYGLAMCLINILLLANVGTWIDRTARLTAAKTLLTVQNLCVVIDCVMLTLFFYFNEEIIETGYTWLPFAIAAAIIICALGKASFSIY